MRKCYVLMDDNGTILDKFSTLRDAKKQAVEDCTHYGVLMRVFHATFSGPVFQAAPAL